MYITYLEIIFVYGIAILFGGMCKAYRDLFIFRKDDLKLPHWGELKTGRTNDSWHYGDGFNDILFISPLFYFSIKYFIVYYSWYLVVLFAFFTLAGYWLGYYQTFLYC